MEDRKYVLATRGKDIAAVRPLTFSNVTIPMRGEGIGSTKAFIFRTNIEYTVTGKTVSTYFR